MDDWCAGITRKLIRNAQESALPFVVFIFIANYILLNIMLAISCDEMKNVSHQQRIFEGECDSLSSRSMIVKNFESRVFTIKHSLYTVLSNISKLIEFNHSFFYSKLKTENKFKNFFSNKIFSNKQSEMELYFLIKELKKWTEKKIDFDDFFLEYKGKIVKIKTDKLPFKINANVELSIQSRNAIMAEKHILNIQREISNLIETKSASSTHDEKNNEEYLENETETLIK